VSNEYEDNILIHYLVTL